MFSTSQGYFRTKIKAPEELAVSINQLKKEGKRIVFCHGVYDVLHYAHMHQFRQARQYGDVLVVSVTADLFVTDRGPNRPMFSEQIRSEVLAGLQDVDFVTHSRAENCVELLQILKPHTYIKGGDSKAKCTPGSGLFLEKQTVESQGGQLVFTNTLPVHSTFLINNHLDPYPEEVLSYLDSFTSKCSFGKFAELVDGLHDLKVLVIGETIIDRYDYVTTMDVSPKGRVISAEHLKTELYAGGILACANHMATFCSKVDLMSALGSEKSYKGFCKKSLAPNVEPWFLIREDKETLVKQRQVDVNSLVKQNETYYGDFKNPLTPEEECLVLNRLSAIAGNYDLIFVLDYGHGIITPKIIQFLNQNIGRAKLAVSTQTNSANKGFHLITKYPRADYVSLDKYEVQLAFSDRDSNPDHMAGLLMDKLEAKMVSVTLGPKGSFITTGNYSSSIPALLKKVVDNVGAGDAYFAISSLAYAAGLGLEVTGFIGNVAGSLAVTIIGNKAPVTKKMVLEFAKILLN
ncbi:adenylyltransferase/cytidyltransferase family protein [Candidatus Parcubacteria bacterium]|nr:adenylyltransferase/cytidyltransferase family protein [Candidatus Parcubacteria bacterium]